MSARLHPYAIFAAVLAAAGLPIYIHAPKFFVDEYGVGLAGLGTVLFGLRLLDVVQDPFLGWLSARLSTKRPVAVVVAALIMAFAMLGLFAVTPPVTPLLWFAAMLGLLFSAFSFLTISFYAQGVVRAESLGSGGHVRLAGWREFGALLGISLAAAAPLALSTVSNSPFALFAALFAVATAIAVLAMQTEWQAPPQAKRIDLWPYLNDPMTRRLLAIALLNAMPVAATSTLFLFFVEYRLEAPSWEGPFLLLFFLSAAAAAPLWTRIALLHGTKPTLMIAMSLAVIAFAAVLFLPLLDRVGFNPGAGRVTEASLTTLTLFYAIVPLGLKLAALGLLTGTRITPRTLNPHLKGAPT